MSSLNIIPPTAEHSCFDYVIELAPAQFTRTWLTYDLMAGGQDRNILIADNPKLIPPRLQQAFERFKAMMPQAAVDRVNRAKRIVNIIHEEPRGIPYAGIAVHKFGPVPVFLLPEPVTIRHKGKDISAQIGIYPFRPDRAELRDSKYADLPTTCGGPHDFAQSMAINPKTVFQRYYEDTAEDMHDIMEHLSLSAALRRAKRIESTLGRSIKSKLRALVPNGPRPLGTPDATTALRWQDFDLLAPALYEADTVRCYSLYVLNLLYALQGIAPKTEKYLDDLNNLPNFYAEKIEADTFAEINEHSKVIQKIHQYIAIQRRSDHARPFIENLEEAEELWQKSKAASDKWLEQMGRFAAFLIRVQASREGSSRTRIFISRPFNVPVVEVVSNQLKNHFKTGGNSLASATLARAQGDVRFLELMKACIWDADTTLAIVPQKLNTHNTGETKTYEWIGVEADHALLLDKQLSFWVEKGTNLDAVAEDLQNVHPRLLSKDWRLDSPQSRAQEIARHFSQVNHTMFSHHSSADSPEPLEASLQSRATELAIKAIRRRAGQILTGLLVQFEPHHRRILLEVLSIVWPRRPHNVGSIAHKLCILYPHHHTTPANSQGAFVKMWAKVRKRALKVPRTLGKDGRITLLRLGKRNRYFTSLIHLARTFLPVTSSREAREWLEEQLQDEYLKANKECRYYKPVKLVFPA